MSKEVKVTARQHFWLDHLRACGRSKHSLKGYAELHGLDVRLFYEAKSRLKRKGAFGAQASKLARRMGAGVVADGTLTMMRPANELPVVYVALEPVDFRKQITGLAALACRRTRKR